MVTFTRTPIGRTAPEKPREPAEMRNVEPIMRLGDSELVRIGTGKNAVRVMVPPVPFEEGLALEQLRQQMNALVVRAAGGQDIEPGDMLEMIRRVVSVAERCVRPIGRMGRLRRRLGLWHPFHRCTEREVGEVLAFLLARRWTSTLRVG